MGEVFHSKLIEKNLEQKMHSNAMSENENESATLFVNCFTMKYSRCDGGIRVTIAGFAVTVNKSAKTLPVVLVTRLRDYLGWSDRAITRFEQILFDKDWQSGLKLYPQSGHVRHLTPQRFGLALQ